VRACFYGWWVVATAALGLCLGAAPIIVYSFAGFFKPLSQEYYAGRAAISFAFTLQNVAAALFAPLTGRLIDQFGARKIILPGTAIFGLTLVSSKLLGGKLDWPGTKSGTVQRSGYWFLHSFSRMRAYMPACYIFPRC